MTFMNYIFIKAKTKKCTLVSISLELLILFELNVIVIILILNKMKEKSSVRQPPHSFNVQLSAIMNKLASMFLCCIFLIRKADGRSKSKEKLSS